MKRVKRKKKSFYSQEFYLFISIFYNFIILHYYNKMRKK